MRMHGSQKRASGDPYFAHPIEVAGILTDYRLDTATIVTALLHDVIEDTAGHPRRDRPSCSATRSASWSRASPSSRGWSSPPSTSARRRTCASSSWPSPRTCACCWSSWPTGCTTCARCSFIKSAAKRERIARETLDIYAPLARSIGCHRICIRAGGAGLRAPQPGGPRRHRPPAGDPARRARARRWRMVSRRDRRRSWRRPASPPGSIGREKHPYSIWRKLQRKSIGFSQLSDIYAFRVIVDTEDDCYRALGVIHRAWPMRARSGSRTSSPRPSATTTARCTPPWSGPRGMRIEMQIRTEAMDRVAEEGVAAHWRYKDKTYGFDPEAAEAAGGARSAGQPAPAGPGAGARRRRRGAGRARQAGDVPRPGVRLHAQGPADQPAAAGPCRWTSPTPCTPTSATPASA